MCKILFTKSILLTLFLLAFFNDSSGQRLGRLGDGIYPSDPSSIYLSGMITHGSKIYVSYSRVLNGNVKLGVAVWDGDSWSYLPEMAYGGGGGIGGLHLVVYQGDLYMVSSHIAAFDLTCIGIHKYDGTAWHSVGGGVHNSNIYGYGDGTITNGLVYNNKLIISGVFDTAGKISTALGLASWDGNKWDSIVPSDDPQVLDPNHSTYISNYYYNTVLFKNELYFLRVDGLYKYDSVNHVSNQVYNVPVFYGGNNSLPSLLASNDSSSLFFMNNTAVGVNLTNNSMALYQYDGNNVTDITYNLKSKYDQSISVYSVKKNKGTVWLAGSFLSKNGKTSFPLLRLVGSQWEPALIIDPSAYEIFSCMTEYNGKLVVGGYFTDLGKEKGFNNIALLDYDIATITGKAFIDNNQNCNFDNGDALLKGKYIHFNPGNHMALTNDSGNYNIVLDTGNYTFSALNKYPLLYQEGISSCNNNTITVNAIGLNNTYANNDFPLQNNTAKDLRVSITGPGGFRTRADIVETYTLNYENTGTVTQTARIEVNKDSRTGYHSASPAPDSVTGNKLIWNISNLMPQQGGNIHIDFAVDHTYLRDTIMHTCAITPVSDDSTFSDNYDTLKQIVVGSFDPNEKQCYPAKIILPDTKRLEYIIRFQNTGTASAYKVRVVDSLDVNLPLKNIVIKAASHNYKVAVENNVIQFIFDNINLPDSNSDEPGSHGFIRYYSDIDPNLPLGTTINNKAYIYFDFNAPILTNTASNVKVSSVLDNVSISNISTTEPNILIYPNPANNYINIESADNDIRKVFLHDITGRMIRETEAKNLNRYIINTASVQPGTYILRVEREKSISTAKIMISH